MKWWLICIRKYVTFEGRARRKEYWMFTLFNVIFAAVAMIVDLFVLGGARNPMQPKYLTMLYGLFCFLPQLAVTVRRLHDIGRSGWWLVGYYVLQLVLSGAMAGGLFLTIMAGKSGGTVLLAGSIVAMLVLCIWMLVWMCFDSKPGENEYGPNPKEGATSELQ